MITMHRLQSIGGAALAAIAALSLTAAPASATDLYIDDGSLMTNIPALGTTEVFGGGAWSSGIIAPSNNTMALFVMLDGSYGGHGFACHVDYPFTNTAHGALVPGNVLRFSCWIALDPGAPVDNQNWQVAFLKMEFIDEDLGDSGNKPPAGARLYDTDRDQDPKIVTWYNNALIEEAWTQFVLEYTYDPAHFDAALLEEVRPVIFHGDWTGAFFNGNIVADGIIFEVFANQAAADASPVDTTNPGPLPPTFVFYAIDMEQALIEGDVVEWVSQLGVQYILEYSDDSGTTWEKAGVAPITGTGGLIRLTDPSGPVSGRTYRIMTPGPVPRTPSDPLP